MPTPASFCCCSPRDSALPTSAVKVPTGPGGVPGILGEATQLRAMAGLPLAEARTAVPTLLGLLCHGDLPARATSALPGVPMLVAYHRPEHHTRPPPVRTAFTAAATWLTALQSATAGESAPPDAAPSRPDLPDLRPNGEGAGDELRALRRRLPRHAAPLTAVHGDFWPGNMLLRGGRVPGVVDCLKLYEQQWLTGSGPGTSKQLLTDRQFAYAKQAHDDHLAALVERGPPGVVALLTLPVSATRRSARALRAPPGNGFAAQVPRPAGIVAALVGLALAGAYYEVLHFRFLWVLLAMVAVLASTPDPDSPDHPDGHGDPP